MMMIEGHCFHPSLECLIPSKFDCPIRTFLRMSMVNLLQNYEGYSSCQCCLSGGDDDGAADGDGGVVGGYIRGGVFAAVVVVVVVEMQLRMSLRILALDCLMRQID